MPAHLTVPIAKQVRPDGDVTWRVLADVLALERATVDELNGRIAAIKSLGGEDD